MQDQDPQATRKPEETPETTAPPGDGGTPESATAPDPARSQAQQDSPPEAQNAAHPGAISGASVPTEAADPPAASPPEVPAVDPKAARIAELETQVNALKGLVDKQNTATLNLRNQHDQALAAMQKNLSDSLQAAASRYKEIVLQVHTDLPPSLIEGGTIDQVEASIVKAKTIVQHVRDTLTAQAAAQVPGGAPVRSGPDIEGMTPIDKIKYSLATRKK